MLTPQLWRDPFQQIAKTFATFTLSQKITLNVIHQSVENSFVHKVSIIDQSGYQWLI